MNNTTDELLAISDMLIHAKNYNLEVECVWSALNEIAKIAKNKNTIDIAQACANALAEWDI